MNEGSRRDMHWSKSISGVGGVMIFGSLLLLSGYLIFSGAKRANRQQASFSNAGESIESILNTGLTLDQLPTGSIALGAPSNMNLGHSYNVALVLSPRKPRRGLESSVSQIVGAGQIETADVKYSLHMDTQLTGPNFDIKSSTPSTQTTTTHDESQWLWDVVPTEAGIQTLHFILHANLDRGGNTVERTVQVQVRDSR
jgi:hypothetical protein